MSDTKKVDIFSLYEREKRITLSDGEKSLDVLFVKMTQGELQDSIKYYNAKLNEERDYIKKNDTEVNEIKNIISMLSQEDIISSIVSIEKVYREQISDLMPVEDEDTKTLEEKSKIREAALLLWEQVRKKELEVIEKQELIEKLFTLRVESLATMKASLAFNNFCLSVMIRDVETKERIFKTAEDVLRLKDKVIIEALLKTLEEFRSNLSEQKIRETSKSDAFTHAGLSQEK